MNKLISSEDVSELDSETIIIVNVAALEFKILEWQWHRRMNDVAGQTGVVFCRGSTPHALPPPLPMQMEVWGFNHPTVQHWEAAVNPYGSVARRPAGGWCVNVTMFAHTLLERMHYARRPIFAERWLMLLDWPTQSHAMRAALCHLARDHTRGLVSADISIELADEVSGRLRTARVGARRG